MQNPSSHLYSQIRSDIEETLQTYFQEYKSDGHDKNYILQKCPFCLDEGSHFYLCISDEVDFETNKPKIGYYNCFKCGQRGRDWLRLKPIITQEVGVKITKAFGQRDQTLTNTLDEYREQVNQWHHNLTASPEDLEYIYSRRIVDMDVIKRFKLGVAIRELEGYGPTRWLTIPYFYRHHLVDVKFRSIPPAPKKFIRIPNGQSILFSYDNIDFDKDYIYITEGEIDAISLFHQGENNVVSITCGAKSFLPEWYELLKPFSRVYLCLDNDRKGQEGARYLAKRLGMDRCINIILPNGTKDLNAFFSDGNDMDDFYSLVLKANTFTMDNIYSVGNVLAEIERNMSHNGTILTGYHLPWEPLTSKMGTITGGDLIYLSGRPGAGKSSFALNVAYDFAKFKDLPILFFCLEMPPIRLGQKLISLHRKVSIDAIGREDVAMSKVELGRTPFYLGYLHGGGEINRDNLFKVFREAQKKYGIELLIFDNIHYLCRSIQHVAQEVSQISRSFKLLAEELDIPIIVIAQPRKIDDETVMSSTHLKDSSAMHADADFILIIHRSRALTSKQIQSEEDLDDAVVFSERARVIIDKARYESGGFANLFFEGDKSYFRLLREDDPL